MTFTKLVEKISKEYSIDILSVGTDMEIHDVALIDNKHDNSYKNTLYFGYDRQLKNLAFLPSQCILAKTPDMNLTNFSLTNIALVTEDNLFTVFNEAKAFIEATRSKGIFEELTALADKTHCLEAVINTASVRLGNSLLFCDMN
ncbi:CdaR family transcriptional regulator, partial [Lachnotalea glycerini]